MSQNLTHKQFITRGFDMLKRFDLDLQLKVREPFEDKKSEILSSLLLKIESGKLHQMVTQVKVHYCGIWGKN